MTSLLLVPLLILGVDEPRWEIAADSDGVRCTAASVATATFAR